MKNSASNLAASCSRTFGSLGLAGLLGSAPLLVTQAAVAATFIFGSDHDGLAGFTQSPLQNPVPPAPAVEFWTTQLNSVQYRNQNSGTLNSSFLRAFTLDRTVGNSYTIEGVVTLTDGYADDNNRVGLYLFGDSAVVPDQLEAGAIGLIFNTDDSSLGGSPGSNNPDAISLRVGIDSTELSLGVRNQTSTPYAQDLFSTTITLTAVVDFTNDGTNDLIQINATLTEQDGTETTTSTSVLAADYPGDYFGFVTRARARNYVEGGANTAEGRSLPFVMDYESFSVVPEPATAGVVGAMAAAMLLIRRRRGRV